MHRRTFLKSLSVISAGLSAGVLPVSVLANKQAVHDFVFTRLSYESGDWDVDERMPANLLNSLIESNTLSDVLT